MTARRAAPLGRCPTAANRRALTVGVPHVGHEAARGRRVGVVLGEGQPRVEEAALAARLGVGVGSGGGGALMSGDDGAGRVGCARRKQREARARVCMRAAPRRFAARMHTAACRALACWFQALYAACGCPGASRRGREVTSSSKSSGSSCAARRLLFSGAPTAPSESPPMHSLEGFLRSNNGDLPLEEVAIIHKARREAIHRVLHKICVACKMGR